MIQGNEPPGHQPPGNQRLTMAEINGKAKDGGRPAAQSLAADPPLGDNPDRARHLDAQTFGMARAIGLVSEPSA